jgi:hypothetical protein
MRPQLILHLIARIKPLPFQIVTLRPNGTDTCRGSHEPIYELLNAIFHRDADES